MYGGVSRLTVSLIVRGKLSHKDNVREPQRLKREESGSVIEPQKETHTHTETHTDTHTQTHTRTHAQRHRKQGLLESYAH